MPFYDYVCEACGRRIEVMHGVHATGPERCDACGGRMQRLISRPSIHFKGSGWAKMDARTASARTDSDSGSNTKGEATDDGPEQEPSAPAAAGSTAPAPAPVPTMAPTTAPSRAGRGDRKSRTPDPSTGADEG